MSRPHYGWWGYVKDIIRRYPTMRGKSLVGAASHWSAWPDGRMKRWVEEWHG